MLEGAESRKAWRDTGLKASVPAVGAARWFAGLPVLTLLKIAAETRPPVVCPVYIVLRTACPQKYFASCSL